MRKTCIKFARTAFALLMFFIFLERIIIFSEGEEAAAPPVGSGAFSFEQDLSTHPADYPHDHRLTMNEVIAYADEWRSGEEWPHGPNPIPLSYVTRAGFIGKSGEAYKFVDDAADPPECWVPENQALFSQLAVEPGGVTNSLAVRQASNGPRGIVIVKISVRPRTGILAYGIEERVPYGWACANITEGGVHANGVIRWGAYYDAAERTFAYTAIPVGAGDADFHGTASFDGSAETISGQKHLSRKPGIKIERTGGYFRVRLTHGTSVPTVIESASSIDSSEWVIVSSLPVGVTQTILPVGDAPWQFFRLRLP